VRCRCVWYGEQLELQAYSTPASSSVHPSVGSVKSDAPLAAKLLILFPTRNSERNGAGDHTSGRRSVGGDRQVGGFVRRLPATSHLEESEISVVLALIGEKLSHQSQINFRRTPMRIYAC
jgi:hypothetical protein